MATQAAASLLDELMGRYRNALPSEREDRLSWESSEVCHYFLVKFCPHELFTNTKSDLGPCEKLHDEELRRQFSTSTAQKKLSYEEEFIRFAESMLSDVDRRIDKGKQRLALSVQEALANSSTGDGRIDEQIQLLSEKITGLVSEAERLGSEGNVEEAQGLSKLCDQLREERDALRRSNESSVWHQAAEMAASQEKQMEVCEICGAFLIVGDAQQRIDDHLMGKQHVGYARLRMAIQEIKELRETRDAQREKEREERRRTIEENDKRRDKDKDDRRRRDDGDRGRRSYGRRGDEREHGRDRERDARNSRTERDYRMSRDRDPERESYRNRDRGHHSSRDKEYDRNGHYPPRDNRRRSRSRDRRDFEYHRERRSRS